MKQKITVLLVGFLLTLGISSCVKDSAPELGSSGNTILKFNEGPRKNLFYSPFPTSTKTEILTFTRDVNSNATLNKPVEVVLLEDPTLVPAGYTELPAANFTYTGSDAGVILTSGKITAIRFAAGEVSKKVKINLIGSAWTNVSIKYAKAYKVTDAAGNQVSAGKGSMIITFAIKNQWDGVYEVTGTQSDVSYPTWTNINDYLGADGPMQYELRTSGADLCDSYDNFFYGGYYVPFADADPATGYGAYGSFSPVFQLDAATNKVIAVTNRYGQPAANGRFITIDPAGFNDYNPSTKIMRVSYFMFQPSFVALPNPRVSFTQEWKYIGPRP